MINRKEKCENFNIHFFFLFCFFSQLNIALFETLTPLVDEQRETGRFEPPVLRLKILQSFVLGGGVHNSIMGWY